MQEGKAQAGLWADSPSFTVAAHELKAPLALIRQLAIELEAGEYTASVDRKTSCRERV